MPLSSDRFTASSDAAIIEVPVAAGAVIHAGAMVVADANGYAAPGSTATGLAYLGRAEAGADNTSGQDGDRRVLVYRGKAFRWTNSGTDPVGQALLGRRCWIEDDATVAGSDGDVGGGPTRSEAGLVVGIDADGVWVA